MRSLIVALALAGLASLPGASRADDEPDQLVPGRLVVIRNGKLAKFVARAPAGAPFDLPDAGNAPTTEGGNLQVFDDHPFRPVSATFALPSAGWKGLGLPAGSSGWRYRGAGSAGDPCRVVLVKGTVVKAVCKGTAVTLLTPFLGQVGIVLTVGTDSKRYCAVFGGEDIRNDTTVLKRKGSDAPVVCPMDLNSSTTFVPTTTTSTSNTGGTTSTTSTTVP
jgi:hypothetical protein